MDIVLKMIKKFLLSAFLSILCVSYTEKQQVDFFTPLRDFLFVPNKIVEDSVYAGEEFSYAYKTSKDGVYLNPWKLVKGKLNLARNIIENGCANTQEADKENILRMAEFVSSSAQKYSYNNIDYALWPYPISYTYGLKPGWISSMSQSGVALILASAYICSNDYKYYSLSKQALNTFQISTKDGGIVVQLEGGSWFAEYAAKDFSSPLVLNGHIYALQNIWHLVDMFPFLKEIRAEGLTALKTHLHKYNIYTWSMYDLYGIPANRIYQQKLHSIQMLQMYELTSDDIFKNYHVLFNFQYFSPISSIQRFLIKPSRFLGFLLFTNFIIFFLLLSLNSIKSLRRK